MPFLSSPPEAVRQQNSFNIVEVSKATTVSRRKLLKGLAGAAVAAPFSSLLPALAQNAPAKAQWNAKTFYFCSLKCHDRFVATPEKFLPQYGGYCALAISLNKIADIEPDQWAIVNDKLYLNNGFIAQSLWSLDKSGNIVRGDQNWPLIPKRGNP